MTLILPERMILARFCTHLVRTIAKITRFPRAVYVTVALSVTEPLPL